MGPGGFVFFNPLFCEIAYLLKRIDSLSVKTGEILGSTKRACRSKSDSLSASVFCLRVPHGDYI